MRILSAGKYTGADARTSCHSGSRRLQLARRGSLYTARGLFETGHAESVVALRIMIITSVWMRSDPSVVSAPRISRSFAASGSWS